MPTNKQNYLLARYKKNITEGREEYAKRKEYLATFVLPKDEEEEEDVEEEETDTGSDVEEPEGGIGNFVGTGELVAPCENKQFRYTSGFKLRWGKWHWGVDLAPKVPGQMGVKILAAGDGVVIKAGNAIGFGQAIVIKHKDDLFTLYGHMPASSIRVKVGEIVKKGQFIATMGQEGGSKGVHLHFEVHIDYEKRYDANKVYTVDPEKFVDCRSSATSVSGGPEEASLHAMHGEEDNHHEDNHEHDHMHHDSLMRSLYYSQREPLTAEEKKVNMIFRSHFPYEPVSVSSNGITKHRGDRETFMIKRIGWVRTEKYQGLKSLNKKRFIHQPHYDGHEGNLYSPDAKRVFESLLLKTKKPYFEVISGFRFSKDGQLSAHEAGCAIDIKVKDMEDVRLIADCAWLVGIRSIGIGGEIDQGKGFIHLDIAPKGKDFMYDGVPIYGGPGKWEMK